jgi:hypothetical protein
MFHRTTDALAAGLAEAPPHWLGKRFDAAGTPLRDAGCTVLCAVDDPGALSALGAVRGRLAAAGLDRFWAWLPERSLHMTVFDVTLHARRDADHWPANLSPDATEADADAEMIRRLSGLRAGPRPPYLMAPQGIYRGEGGVGVGLSSAGMEEDKRLRALRDQLAIATGLTHRPGHAVYRFHITLGYMIAWPSMAEAARADALFDAAEDALRAAAPVIALGLPDIRTFDDMTAFRRVGALT